jgi:ribonuclease BN (tRNA processing enzyme)
MEQLVKIVMLGTGTPNALPDKSGPAIALVVGEQVYLLDCGPGVVRRAEAAVPFGVPELVSKNLCRVFLTHLHSDHTAGLADLLLTPWVLGREQALQVFGPCGTYKMCHHLEQAYQVDIQNRVYGAEQANKQGIHIYAKEYKEGLFYEDEHIRIEAYPMLHPPFEAYGFRITTPNGIIVFSGDTAPCLGIEQAAKGCDLLIHEVYSAKGVQTRTPKWYKYHTSVHTSELELAALVRVTQPKTLVLTHQLWMLGENESGSEITKESREAEVIVNIATEYHGQIISAQDLDTIILDSQGNIRLQRS